MEEEGDNRNPDAKKVAELEIQHFDEPKSVGKKLHFFYYFYFVLRAVLSPFMWTVL